MRSRSLITISLLTILSKTGPLIQINSVVAPRANAFKTKDFYTKVHSFNE